VASALGSDVFGVEPITLSGMLLESPESAVGHACDLVLTPPQFAVGPVGQLCKRVLDLVVAFAILFLMLPLAVTTALLIRATSPGPVLFRQTRVGRDGRHFQIFKFRTMVDNADTLKAALSGRSEAHGLFKIRGDPRLTGVGRLLRRTYLDELPQFLNVIRGEMSVVGPRPLIVEEDAAITGSGRQRLAMRPGITGEWQVLRGGGASLDEMIATDFRYVTEWTLWRDVRCLGKTAMFVLRLKGW
jgi:lipopolysaccharide/colanic/teichoic acid biosynthesis glycosyltransferase